MTLNTDTGSADQFHPTLSVQSNGSGGDKVTVTFYDRRDDTQNCEAHVYATQSTDNGATWSANVRETSAPSNFDGNPNGPGGYSSSTPFSTGGLALLQRPSDLEPGNLSDRSLRDLHGERPVAFLVLG